MSEVLPALLGCAESNSLQMMNLASQRIQLEDHATGMSAQALANCASLRLLCLDGWTFRIDVSNFYTSLRIIQRYLFMTIFYMLFFDLFLNIESYYVFCIACIFYIYIGTRIGSI